VAKVPRKSRPAVDIISPELLLQGYRLGVFPMGMEDGSVHWFSPDPRAILPLDGFKINHGLRRALAKKKFDIEIDKSFGEVIRACADRDETWITPKIIASYEHLHDLGYAHSVEAWHEGKLAGGLYGVAVGGAFFGESMFHCVTDASKVALVGLVERMKAQRFVLLDTQWTTPHLEQFGATEISRRAYLRLLAQAVELKRSFE
jgi:leucyl/phenylalanyl-tRNA--protein transferase